MGSKLDLCRSFLVGDLRIKPQTEQRAVLKGFLEVELKLLNLTSSWLDVFLPHCLRKVNRWVANHRTWFAK